MRLQSLAIFALAGVLSLSSCADLQVGSDPVVVNAERTITTSVDTFDTFVRLEYENRAALAKASPQIHAYANTIRQHALTEWVPSARALKDAYKLHRTAENKANLMTALAVLQEAVSQSQRYIQQANQP